MGVGNLAHFMHKQITFSLSAGLKLEQGVGLSPLTLTTVLVSLTIFFHSLRHFVVSG